jgi:spore coat polysaccharide biosynthesis protein SpsF (cytidylyltransferase family)
MGKEAKKHRAKVAKRNAKVKEQKSGMQKAFDLLMKQQIDAMANEENLKAQIGDQELNFEVVEEIYKNLYPNKPDFGLEDILDFFNTHSELQDKNKHFIGDEGYGKFFK